MTTITLTAFPGHFIEGEGRNMVLVITNPFSRKTAEVKTLNDVREAVAAFGKDVSTANGGLSFHVGVHVNRGHRKMPGFDKANEKNGLGEEAWMQTKPEGSDVQDTPRKAA